MEHLVAIADLNPADLGHLLSLAKRLKAEWRRSANKPLLKRKTLGMIFQKPSLRTRVSFDMAMLHLGGQALYLSPQEIGLGQRESVADVARVVSRYVDGIMARVFAHAHVVELAQYSRVPVVNGLSDWEHPCQAVADVLTIVEKRRTLKGQKVVFVGDGNNVARSLMYACALGGSHFVLSAPPGYGMDEASVEVAKRLGQPSGATFSFVEDPHAAVQGANVIYTDVWASMGQEAEAEKRAKVFPPYQVNQALVAEADPKVIVLHCLPAHRGMEITDEVMDGPHSVVFDQAENRMHAQKAILVELLAGRKNKK